MLKGKKVLVLGLAKSGRAAVELLDAMHATITVNEFAAKDHIDCYDEYLASDEMARKRQVYSMSEEDENDN